MEDTNTETAYNCIQFSYFNFKCQNATKTSGLQWRTQLRKLSTAVDIFRILIFSGKTQRNMRFAMEYTNTETVYNCSQFLYFNFNLQNANKAVYCNGKPYGNCLQICS